MNNTREKGVTTLPQEATSSPAALDAWIARATLGLCAQAKERVRREITSHHAEAVEDSFASGLSPEAASTRALTGLGDAAKANKALRKTYLTTWQQRLLAELARPPAPIAMKDYSSIVFNSAAGPIVALISVTNQFRFTLWEQLPLVPVLVLWVLCLFRSSNVLPFLCDLFGTKGKGEKPLTANPVFGRLYPWLLIASYASLYAAWRCYHWNSNLALGRLPSDLCLIGAGAELYAIIHRKMRMCVFSQSTMPPRKQLVASISYITFLFSASVASALWPPSVVLQILSWYLRPLIGFELAQAYHCFLLEGEGDAPFVYGIVGFVLALVLFTAAVRWTIGLCLLRKDLEGDRHAEPGPVPYPETPLGE